MRKLLMATTFLMGFATQAQAIFEVDYYGDITPGESLPFGFDIAPYWDLLCNYPASCEDGSSNFVFFSAPVPELISVSATELGGGTFTIGPNYIYGYGGGFTAQIGDAPVFVPTGSYELFLQSDSIVPSPAVLYGTISATAAPELSTWAMLGLGFGFLAFAGARRRAAA